MKARDLVELGAKIVQAHEFNDGGATERVQRLVGSFCVHKSLKIPVCSTSSQVLGCIIIYGARLVEEGTAQQQ